MCWGVGGSKHAVHCNLLNGSGNGAHLIRLRWDEVCQHTSVVSTLGSVSKYLFATYSVLGTVLRTGDTGVNKMQSTMFMVVNNKAEPG